MQKSWWRLKLAFIGLGGGWFLGFHLWPIFSPPSVVLPPSTSDTEPSPASKSDLSYVSHTLPQAVVHTLRIPARSQFVVIPAVAPTLEYLDNFAHQQGAIAALNGGFFDPHNQQTTSHVIQQGERLVDPRLNPRLINNPDLAPYLSQILNRSEFRHSGNQPH
ncbi:MAG: hypothetical protein F6K19_17120 [Cyanothece sp. SIO1E1]|nr:hypothetical protein [Cyanothece sp. SIO1E1]